MKVMITIIVIIERQHNNTEADLLSYRNNFIYERLKEYRDVFGRLGIVNNKIEEI